MPTARGSFEVDLTARDSEASEAGEAVSRLSISKTYTGDLVASGRGQMIACRTDIDGSAGYVAIEVVEGELDGTLGSFVLQHNGLMDRGDTTLAVTIIPDSGTEDLAGIRGDLSIEVEDGQHRYVLNYEIIG